MTIATGLDLVGEDDLADALEEHLAPRITALVRRHAAGHCMRCDDLDIELAGRLTRRLRSSTGAQIHVLGTPPTIPNDVATSSTKIVELRNPDADGVLRPPLLVFVPPGTRASAEDSFGVATFEQVTLGRVYDTLADELMSGLAEGMASGIRELFAVLRDERSALAGGRARCRFLLTIARNNHDRHAAGAAVCELGMIPDPDLIDGPVTSRAARNIRTVRQLHESLKPDRQRVLAIGLTDPDFRRSLAAFAARTGLTDPMVWTRAIVAERENWGFFFGDWPLREATSYDEIGIRVGILDLPTAGASDQDATNLVLRGITGQHYLPVGVGGMKELSVPFRLDRDPRQVSGLARFRVQLMAERIDGETAAGTPTEVAAVVKVSTTARLGYRAKLRKLTGSGVEEGWHYVRVTAVDAEGLPIANPRDDTGGLPVHESERFYVLPDGDLEGPPPAQRRRSAAGVTQAARGLEFDAAAAGRAVDSVGSRAATWQNPPRGFASAGPRTLVCDFGADGLVDVAVSAHLSDIQQRILTDPDTATHWRLGVSVTDPASSVETATGEVSRWPEHADADRRDTFLAARSDLFGHIGAPSGGTVGSLLPVEACDLYAAHDLVIRYVDSYARLLDELLLTTDRPGGDSSDALTALADLARIDTVTVTLTDHRAKTHEAVLVGPTHPQRLLWLTAWSFAGRHWAGAATDRAGAQAAQRALLRLRPIGHPFAIPRASGRLALATFDLTPYWAVCLPDGTADPQGLMAMLQTALGIPERAALADVWSGAALADRFELYLRQHPYVRTLLVNAINVGRGDEIAEAAELLLRNRPRSVAAGLDLRLYVADPEAPGNADAVIELLDGPDSLPELTVAVRDRREFGVTDEDDVHLTVLFDALSTERVGTAAADQSAAARPSPVHGLVQDMAVSYTDDLGSPTVWRKHPRYGVAGELPGAEELTDLLSTLPQTMSSVAATVAIGQFCDNRVPEVSLALTADDSSLLDLAHRRSDWVITVDRTLGVEFFDGPTRKDRPDHVIDYTPESATTLGHHMVVSSRSLDELRALLEPILTANGLAVEKRHVGTFFDQLRLLSGRLAFKIASIAPNQRTEVLGLALARLYLDRQGDLAERILVPLDAHLDLYQQQADLADPDLRRTDLALFDLDLETRMITCRLVEVKCYTTDLGIAGYHGLKDRIRGQLDRSMAIITAHFDPSATARPDRVVKNFELANLLQSYLNRACRHHLVSTSVAADATMLLDTLDNGYLLRFTRSALVFDLNGRGSDVETEDGVAFVRIGRDIVQELLDAVPTGPLEPVGEPAARSNMPDEGPDEPPEASRSPEPSAPVPPEPIGPGQMASPSTGKPGEGAPSHVPPQAAVGAQGLPSDPVLPAERGSSNPTGARERAAIDVDIVVGTSRRTPQFGIIGETSPNKLVAIDLNETHTVSLFGVQGGGKSYTVGTIIEAATMSTPPLNQLASPLATIVFHYSATQDYAPEFTSMTAANDDVDAAVRLRERFGVEPLPLTDVVLLAPKDQCVKRRAEYTGIQVHPLTFGSAELQATHWRFLMGAVGNQAIYIRQLNRIMKAHRNDLRLDVLRTAVEESSLPDHIKTLAQQRLDLAGDYIDDGVRLGDLVVPGRLIIVDLRDELIVKDEALGLFVVLMQIFADAPGGDHRFNKLVVFDEAHKYIDSAELVKGLVESVREMRHKGMSVLVASQDPPSVPVSLIELSDHIILHKFTSPAWLKHLQKANAALATVTSERLAELQPGEAYLWASKSTDPAFTDRMVKIRTRPRLTRHGGATRTATGST